MDYSLRTIWKNPFFAEFILPSKGKIVDPVFLRENISQQKVAFTHILCSDTSMSFR